MNKKPVAVVLGGTNPHVALIENLKTRGYSTVLVDYYANPPAARVADKHIRESTLDLEKVLAVAKQTDAILVISTCVDQANVTACYVAEKLGLPAPYSYKTALNVTDKRIMKNMMLEGGVPTSRYIVVDKTGDSQVASLTFPVVVKPSDSNGSKGVKKTYNLSELDKGLCAAFDISRAGTAIVEEFCEGKEISVDCFVQNQKAHVIMLRQKYNMIYNEDSVIACYASIAPAKVSSETTRAIQKIAGDISRIFGLDNTSLLIQLMVDGDKIKVIEFAPRVGGGLSYRTVKLNTGFDILDATINSYLGVPSILEYSMPEIYYSANNVYAFTGVFGSAENYQQLIKDGVIEEYYPHKTRGMEIGSDMASRDRVCSFVAQDRDEKALLSKIKKTIDTLDIYDLDGRSIIKRDIYVKELI